MNQSTVLPLAVATLVLEQLHALVTLSSQPCLALREQIMDRTARFLGQPITPAATLDFEKALRALLDECGRLVLELVVNHIEPTTPQQAPKNIQRDRHDYCRKNHKSPVRDGIATLFGHIELRRCLYEPLQEGRDDGQRCFAPLQVCLGIVENNATPALAERVGRLSANHTQQEILDLLESDHHVCWSTEVLRRVAAAVSAGISHHLPAAQQQQLLGWLAQAQQSRGRHRPTLSTGRDGIMLPIRGAPHCKEGAVATLSVLDRRGRRIGTVYLGHMPEAGQGTLSAALTELLRSVLAAWDGPMPRLVYLSDAGYHQTAYFLEVLSQMDNPRRPTERLEWLWIVDFYHAAQYVSKLANVLFDEEKSRQAWSRRMRRVMRDEQRGVQRVLASAAQYHGKKPRDEQAENDYDEADNYLNKDRPMMDYHSYRRAGLPIGSGVTEAGCKVVFSQRFKQSGMTWGSHGGEVILHLRLAQLSGVWEQVYHHFLSSCPLVPLATQLSVSAKIAENAA
jgi:hypothetical protein